MHGKVLAGFLVAGMSAVAGASQTIYVDVDNAGDPSQDGSAAHPYAVVQHAVDAANNGDEIIVLPGEYVGLVNLAGKALHLRSLAGPDVTILNGEHMGPVVTITNGEGRDTIVEGFTLEHGAHELGGGVWIVGSSPTIRGNHIHHCEAEYGGGIVSEIGGSPLIIGNVIEDCHAIHGHLRHLTGDGGGIAVSRAYPIIVNNLILGCTAYRRGGGIAIVGEPEEAPTTAQIVGNLIVGNSADGFDLVTTVAGGGGVAVAGNAVVRVAGCTISGNFATRQEAQADGVYCFGIDADVTLDSCIVWGNAGAFSLPEIKTDNNASLTIHHCIVAGGQPAVVVAGAAALHWGAGNLDADPLFADAETGDYTLAPCSPAINAGDPAYAPLPAEASADGHPRLSGPAIDIGAFEHDYHDCNGNGVGDACDLASGTTHDENGDGIPDPCQQLCPGDVNGDSAVNLTDLATLLVSFGTPSGMTLANGDLDGDADVDLTDLAVLLSNFGTACP